MGLDQTIFEAKGKCYSISVFSPKYYISTKYYMVLRVIQLVKKGHSKKNVLNVKVTQILGCLDSLYRRFKHPRKRAKRSWAACSIVFVEKYSIKKTAVFSNNK